MKKLLISIIAAVLISTVSNAQDMEWKGNFNVPAECSFANDQQGVMNWDSASNSFTTSTNGREIASVTVTALGATGTQVVTDSKLYYRAANTTGALSEVAGLVATVDYTATGNASTINNRTGNPSIQNQTLSVTGLTPANTRYNNTVRFNIKGSVSLSEAVSTGETDMSVYFPQGDNDYFVKHTVSCIQ